MDRILKGRRYFNIKRLLVASIFIILLLTNAAAVFAAPFFEDPGKMDLFFSWDHIGSGSFGDNNIKSFTGTSCGVAIPVGFATIGIKTTFDTSEGYYEVFSDFNSNKYLMTNLSFQHVKDKSDKSVSIFRVGAFRPVTVDSTGLDILLGPGLSVVSADSDTNLSMFLQAKTKVYFMEGSFLYANGLYDFMYKSGDVELGIGFSY
jgi:hypothetical protein